MPLPVLTVDDNVIQIGSGICGVRSEDFVHEALKGSGRPEHKKKVVQSELEAMLEMGVIEESHSDWASPIVLVPKTDGSVRFCVDYRKVNAVSKFDAYPMPRVDELLDRLGTARFYSTLDLTKGYWQSPLPLGE